PLWAQAPPKDPPVDAAQVQQLTDRGVARYEGGTYEEALGLFREAYALDPQPGFLFNEALCYEKLHRAREALDAVRSYLRLAPPKDPLRAKALALLDSLRDAPGASPKDAGTRGHGPSTGLLAGAGLLGGGSLLAGGLALDAILRGKRLERE